MTELFSGIDAGWLYSAFAFIALGSTVVIILVILSENRNPVKSLAWVTVLLLLPVVGLILYLFFGRNFKNKRMISRRSRRRLRKQEPRVGADPREQNLDERSVQTITIAHTLTGAQFYTANTVEAFTNGTDKFRALEADLSHAQNSINIQYYIFEDDNIGTRIASILTERAHAGVKVRVLYDHVGSIGVRNKFFRKLKESGIECQPFLKVTFPELATHINWRNHRKLCIIDNCIGYIGGMNIADRYIDGGKTFGHWRDTHLRITGPAVAALQYSFAVDWSFTKGSLIENDATAVNTAPRTGADATSGICAQLITSGPTSQFANVGMAFHHAIASAKRRVYIQTPYFLPTEGLLKALQVVALAHVDVRIMMPAKSDSWMLTHASKSYISECLRSGIKIYLYDTGMLHSKMMIVDDELVSVGSTNFDFRSFECNFESNLFIYSKEFNNRMLEIFRNDLTQCTRVSAAQWRKRRLSMKAAESFLRLLSPVL